MAQPVVCHSEKDASRSCVAELHGAESPAPSELLLCHEHLAHSRAYTYTELIPLVLTDYILHLCRQSEVDNFSWAVFHLENQVFTAYRGIQMVFHSKIVLCHITFIKTYAKGMVYVCNFSV